MKVLCKKFDCALYFIITGWKNVFEHLGYEWKWWNPAEKCAFDIFNEYEPNIYIGTTYNIDRAEIKCIIARPNMKVVFKVNNWGSTDNEIDRKIYPIGIADQPEKDLICDLRQKCGKPDFLFNFYHPSQMDQIMGDWDKNGVSTISMQQAADIYTYLPHTQFNKSLQCDIAFIGGYWSFKSSGIDPYLRPITYPVGKYNIKLFGNSIWPYPQYCGTIPIEREKELYQSAIICPNFFEPHAIFFPELNERVFQLAISKAFCINTPAIGLKDIYTQYENIIANDPLHFEDLVHMYWINPELRQNSIDLCYNTIVKNHTYNNRISNLLFSLGYEEESKKCLELKDEYLESYSE